MIRTEALCKRFGDKVAVAELDLAIPEGEFFCFLGPNGAGKTTTIHMIVGALPSDDGTVVIGDSNDTRRPEVRRHIGFAPQALSLYDGLTGEENLRFFASIYGLRGRHLDERVAWALDFAGLTDRRRDLVSTYSGGMARRLNVACALLHEPTMLLLDEPTVGVDPHSRNHILEAIEGFQRSGLAVLLTTHQMEVAQRLCDRVGIMDHGKMLDVGSPAELIARHGGLSAVEATLARPPKADIHLPGAFEDDTLRFDSARPLEEVAALSAAGVEFATLNIHRPDLETVFLNLTGRRLRD
jgi:ABC-2 type transport system ATP-binding protein